MTKFTTITNSKKKKTVFTKIVCCDEVIETAAKTEDFDNVLHIGEDSSYGDVFKAWNDTKEDDFIIFFGEKGNEFK